MNVVIIDYGLSNLLSVERAVERCGESPEITGDPARALAADALILPGVGAFADGMRGLREAGLVEPILKKVAEGAPLLGVCLGMQLLFDASAEFGRHEGLGLIHGEVERIPELDSGGRRLRSPHIGWQPLKPYVEGAFASTPLRAFPEGGEVYFVHSFEAKPSESACALAYCEYGGRRICAAAVNKAGNVLGTQFHPEKSGEAGITIINEFLREARGCD